MAADWPAYSKWTEKEYFAQTMGYVQVMIYTMNNK
jgi:hypothetical protein